MRPDRSAASIGGVPVKADESVEPGTAELRDGETVVAKIENVSAARPSREEYRGVTSASGARKAEPVKPGRSPNDPGGSSAAWLRRVWHALTLRHHQTYPEGRIGVCNCGWRKHG